MAVTREQVWQALFNLLSSDPGVGQQVSTFTRRYMLPRNVDDNVAFIQAGGKYPVLIVKEDDEDTKQSIGTPANREWVGWIVVYTKNADHTITGDTIINPIVDAIEAALAPKGQDAMFGRQTLGNLVYRCWIEGTSVKYSGDEDPEGRGGCALPIKIKVP